MLSLEDIAKYLGYFKGLPIGDMLPLTTHARIRYLKAGETYIAEGSTSQRMAYVKRGLIRTFSRKPNGDETTLMLRWEDQFVASIDSIIRQQPSRFTYQALEDTTLIEVDYSLVSPIIDDNPRLSTLRSKFLLDMLSQAMYRVEGFVLLSPEERYLKLLHEKQDIVNRVPDKYLATLLGITPVSLSRIRKRIAKQGTR